MIEEWRQWLYPLGALPAIAFTARYLIQWLASEKANKSVVMPLFWHLSITGNLLLFFHSLIQMQFHVCAVQACNAVIAWRNLDLMYASPKMTFRSVLFLLSGSLLSVFLMFFLINFFSSTSPVWFRSPLSNGGDVNSFWHLLGFLGLMFFNGRFWVQWWGAERNQVSYLGVEFWWMSVIGSVLCLLYFAFLGDYVNMVGPIFGFIPAVRNLIIIRRAEA
jgi:lipid-A-disaccharide synthase